MGRAGREITVTGLVKIGQIANDDIIDDKIGGEDTKAVMASLRMLITKITFAPMALPICGIVVRRS